MLGVPEELGGVMHEQSAVTSVLIGEALAHGDMGIAYAALAPGAVATAIGHWGSAEQEATYLPAFTGEDVPAAALAILEPRPLFDPLKLETKARKDGGEWVLDGTKSLLARAKDCELFVVAAEAEGLGPALFVVESGTKGLSVEEEPAMGLRPAATGRLLIEGVRLPAGALLGEGKREDYVECIDRSRIAWCALAVGTSQAVLDYVMPYVNERTAFGEPISNRQAVAFARLRHRHRVRRHAARHLPSGQPLRPGPGLRPRDRRWLAGSAPSRACRSAPKECSCSVATASSRSTRSSAGTETFEQRA